MLRSDMEERLIAKWYDQLPAWSMIIDGGIPTNKIKRYIKSEERSKPMEKGVVGVVKSSKMGFLDSEMIAQVYGLKYRERSCIFTANQIENINKGDVWSSFFKLRPEQPGNPMWGTVMLNMTAVPKIVAMKEQGQ